MTYIIGDVHGEYKSLLALVKKLPLKSKLIFVGDLVDRGKQSKEVIAFIRKNKYACVLGNHDQMMLEYCKNFIEKYPSFSFRDSISLWLKNGGKETLLSYGLIRIDKCDGKILLLENEKNLQLLKEDIGWLESLPLYLELELKKEHKTIVISHAPIADVWMFRNDAKKQKIFKEYALWNRNNPKENSDIFNIFRHNVIKKVDLGKHYINVDTGCHYVKDGYGILSAYCIEKMKYVKLNKYLNMQQLSIIILKKYYCKSVV